MRFLRKNIIFVTGGNSLTLLFNMDKRKIDTKEINAMVISNIHGGQTGKK